MSTTYNGNGNAPTTPQGYARKIVTAATNANPIVITTSTNHGYTSGDTVVIEGALGNTAANGRFVCTVLTPTTFSIPVAGNGAWTSGGYSIDYAVLPQVTIPSDGDDFTASAFNPAYQGLQDKAPFLYERVGRYRLYTIYEAATTDDTWAAWSSNAPGSFGAASWSAVSSGSPIFGFAAPIPVAIQNDVLEIWATVSYTTSGTVGGVFAAGLGVVLDGALAQIAGSGQRLGPLQGTQTANALSLHAFYTVVAAGQHTIDFALTGYGNGAITGNVSFVGHRQFTVHHLRPN